MQQDVSHNENKMKCVHQTCSAWYLQHALQVPGQAKTTLHKLQT